MNSLVCRFWWGTSSESKFLALNGGQVVASLQSNSGAGWSESVIWELFEPESVLAILHL